MSLERSTFALVGLCLYFKSVIYGICRKLKLETRLWTLFYFAVDAFAVIETDMPIPSIHD